MRPETPIDTLLKSVSGALVILPAHWTNIRDMARDELHRYKRNLMLISTVVILYVITGTNVEDIRGARVYFLDLQINRPEILVYFGCLLLLWYWYQFWLSHKGQARFRADRENLHRHQPFLLRFAEKQIRKAENIKERLRVTQVQLSKHDGKYILQTNRIQIENRAGQWEESGKRNIELSGARWNWVRFRNWISVAFSKSTRFWDEVFPHLFALISVLAAILDWRF